ncbi:hypothetical protein [Bradyrhizobium sp. 1200_D9_N1_1]|uniref:hypothetical protein n=1 Tax=Bradyrhizobium sp. 1200_D9_N1_1 TaxID=3239013 RepID=UPI003F8BD6B9
MNILEAIDDPNLFGPWFKDAKTWTAWRVFLAALFGLPMTDEQLAVYKECTGRTEPPAEAATEGWLQVGRRGGKSLNMALIAVYLATFRDYRPYLVPGERGLVAVMASDKKQARTILRYASAMLTRIPMLAKMVDREHAEGFDLNNDVSIEITTASLRAARGYTMVAALLDEIAFFRSEDSANPDYEILNSIRPAMGTIPNALLLCGSSPYSKSGELYRNWKEYFGKPNDDGVLFWKAPTPTMNPTFRRRIIDKALERDKEAATAEYLAEFRNDIASFVDREIVEACVTNGERERAWSSQHRYVAFVDPSGGSSDSMTLAIGHREANMTIVDVVREIPAPFDPESATEEYVKLIKSYQISYVTGDRYAGQWCQQAFQKRGITYHPCDTPKSGLYTDLLPKLNSKLIRIPDAPKLVNQLASLERRTARGGRDSIDHAPGGHDDVANAVAGVAHCAVNRHTITRTPLRL